MLVKQTVNNDVRKVSESFISDIENKIKYFKKNENNIAETILNV